MNRIPQSDVLAGRERSGNGHEYVPELKDIGSFDNLPPIMCMPKFVCLSLDRQSSAIAIPGKEMWLRQGTVVGVGVGADVKVKCGGRFAYAGNAIITIEPTDGPFKNHRLVFLSHESLVFMLDHKLTTE